MSDRGAFRGRGRGGAGYGFRGGRGGYQQQNEGQASAQRQEKTQERPKKENILNLAKYMDKEVRVKFSGGREGWLMRLLLLLKFS